MPTFTEYVYTANVDPNNSSVAFSYEGKLVALGETIELNDDQLGVLSQHFVLKPLGGVEKPEIEEVVEPANNGPTSDSAGTLSDKHKTASRSSKS